MSDYIKITDKLIESNIVTYGDVFRFDGTPMEKLYSSVFEVCQSNLDNYGKFFNVYPASFFFKSNVKFGAQAGKANGGLYFISMNMVNIVELHQLFLEYYPSEKGKKPMGYIMDRENEPVGYIMWQVAILFMFYHEFAHLIQLSDLRNFIDDEEQNENYCIENHLCELDADSFAVKCICNDILLKLNKPNDVRILNMLTGTVLSSLFILFFRSQGRPEKIYYNKNSHPHPMIRISYILNFIMSDLEKRKPNIIPLDRRTVFADFYNGVRIRMDEIFPGYNMTEYHKFIMEESKSINEYIDSLIKHSLFDSQLVMNRYPIF